MDSCISPEQFQRSKQLLFLAKDVGTMKLRVSHFLSPRKAYRQEGQDIQEKELNILSWGAFTFISALCGFYGHSSSHRMILLLQERELLFSIQASVRVRYTPLRARFCLLKAKVYKHGA